MAAGSDALTVDGTSLQVCSCSSRLTSGIFCASWESEDSVTLLAVYQIFDSNPVFSGLTFGKIYGFLNYECEVFADALKQHLRS